MVGNDKYKKLDVSRVRLVWNKLIQTHDMLRTVVFEEGYQQVLKEVPELEIPYWDVSKGENICEYNDFRQQMGNHVYDTGKWPMFGIAVAKKAEESILYFSMDFLIADWTSIWMLLSEFEALYYLKKDSINVPQITFRDYLSAERKLKESERYVNDKRYWEKRIAYLPDAPELPTLSAEDVKKNFTRKLLCLDSERWNSFKDAAKKLGITPSIRMLQETAKILGLTKEDVLLSWLPVEHTFGLIYFLLLPIYVGCRQVHMATSMFAENPLTWLEQINHYRATVTAGPNFAYQIVLNNMTENCHWDLSCLRYILNGGEPISKKNLHKFLDANKQYHLKENCLIPIYGMTETSGAVVLNVPYREPDIDTKQVDTGIDFDLKSIDILKNDLVCQGKTINGCSIRIVDDFNRDLGQMKVGNIQFKGEFLCKGYLNKDNKDLFADGWLCTGDIGFLSGQNLYIVGRKKDMFFMHGKNIYMRDIEQIIFERYGVRSAACGENNAMEEKSKIYLFMELEISSAEYTKKKKEIIMFIQGETGIKLSDVIFKDDMFMTQVGKFSKAELLKKYKKQNCPEVNS